MRGGPVRQDLDLWRRLASMSTEQGFLRQAIYCLNKVVHGDRDDVHAQWDRAVLYTDIGQHKRARICEPPPPLRHTPPPPPAPHSFLGNPTLSLRCALTLCSVAHAGETRPASSARFQIPFQLAVSSEGCDMALAFSEVVGGPLHAAPAVSAATGGATRLLRVMTLSRCLSAEQAIAAFERIHTLRPGDAEVIKVLSRLYFRMRVHTPPPPPPFPFTAIVNVVLIASSQSGGMDAAEEAVCGGGRKWVELRGVKAGAGIDNQMVHSSEVSRERGEKTCGGGRRTWAGPSRCWRSTCGSTRGRWT